MLEDKHYQQAAEILSVPVAAIKAFAEVESRGSGFLPDGHPKILFERHVMYRLLSTKLGAKKADALSVQFPEIVNKSPGGYGKESAQPSRLEAAATIDRDCALASASWGAFQIMGYHWKALGYSSIQEFINAMYRSEPDQLDAFVRFVKMDSRLVAALQSRNWDSAARIYNGPNYKDNDYATKMAKAYARAGGA